MDTRLSIIHAEIAKHETVFQRLLELLELCDQKQRANMTQVAASTTGRLDRLQSLMESLVQNLIGSSGGGVPQLTLKMIHPSFQTRSVKLDFPRFGGVDVLEWIYKA